MHGIANFHGFKREVRGRVGDDAIGTVCYVGILAFERARCRHDMDTVPLGRNVIVELFDAIASNGHHIIVRALAEKGPVDAYCRALVHIECCAFGKDKGYTAIDRECVAYEIRDVVSELGVL